MNRNDSKSDPPERPPLPAHVEVDDESTDIVGQAAIDPRILRGLDSDTTSVTSSRPPRSRVTAGVNDEREEATAINADASSSWDARDASDIEDNTDETTGMTTRSAIEAGGITDRTPDVVQPEQHALEHPLVHNDVTEAADLPSAYEIALAMQPEGDTDVSRQAVRQSTSDVLGQSISDSIEQVKRQAADAFSKIADGRADSGERRVDPLVGTVLMERYEVVKRIGLGGMSLVYLGRHVTIDKAVAIKVLAPQLAVWSEYVKRFLQEARAASMIRHINVVDITDFGYTEMDNLPFFVMEYLEGEDLQDRLQRMGRLSWLGARGIALQMCAALEAAHRKGVIHRDIKPENCFILDCEDGTEQVKLLDFGIAKVASDEDAGSLTAHGVVLGTVEYISPERAQKKPVDIRADIYSLGVLLFRMVTGFTPFHGEPVDVVSAHVYTKAPVPSRVAPDANIHPDLDAAIVKAMAKKPDKRFQTVAEMSAALQAIPVPAMPMAAMPTGRSSSYGIQRPPTIPPMALDSMSGVEMSQAQVNHQSLLFVPPQRDTSRALLLVGGFVVVLLIVIVIILLTAL